MKKLNIAIIDSGIGGISVLSELFKNINGSNLFYFADVKNMPYGSKTKKELLQITVKNLNFIIKKYKPKIIVFGCNTIGSTILNEIKQIFSNIKIYAINPNIYSLIKKCDCKYSNNKFKILLLATHRTIESIKKDNNYIKNKSCIILCKMQKLATIIENNPYNIEKIVPYIKHKLSKYCNKNIKYLVLGCTHYYFVRNEIKQLFKNCILINNIDMLVNEIKNDNLELLENKKYKFSKVKFIFSKKQKDIKNIYKNLFNSLIKN